MRIVFMGTPEFAVPSLRGLAIHHEVVLVVTRPDAVRGRGKALVASPVKACALELGLSVFETSKVSEELLDTVRALAPDLICVTAFGCLLPDELLDAALYGAINVHASLLPRWRGAAPIQRAILAGDEKLGVSIMQIVPELDAGNYALQKSINAEDKNFSELSGELAELGAQALLEVLEDLAAERVIWHEQDTAQVSYAHKIEKNELFLSPSDSCVANILRVRAASDAAPARCRIGGRSVRIYAARAASDVAESTSSNQPSTGSYCVQNKRLLLGTCDGSLEVCELQPEGKKKMDAQAFCAGLQTKHGSWESL